MQPTSVTFLTHMLCTLVKYRTYSFKAQFWQTCVTRKTNQTWTIPPGRPLRLSSRLSDLSQSAPTSCINVPFALIWYREMWQIINICPIPTFEFIINITKWNPFFVIRWEQTSGEIERSTFCSKIKNWSDWIIHRSYFQLMNEKVY